MRGPGASHKCGIYYKRASLGLSGRTGRTSEISVKAKFGIAPIQDRRPGNKQVRAARLKGKGRSEDRPNAVTLITLRLLRELRLCQVAIINYTRWPFLNRRSASVRRTYPSAQSG